MLDAEPLLAGASPSGLDFIGDEEPAVFACDLGGALEIAGRRNDEAADTQDRLGHKRRDLAGGRRHDDILYVIGAGEPAVWIAELERAAIAVGRARMHDACDLRG